MPVALIEEIEERWENAVYTPDVFFGTKECQMRVTEPDVFTS